jgi:hypothetical protein
MMVKIGRTAVINMTAISSVHLLTEKETITTKCGWFEKKIKDIKTTYAVKIYFKDEHGKDSNYKLYGFDDILAAEKIKDEVMSQIKELELEHLTATLENAIKNN